MERTTLRGECLAEFIGTFTFLFFGMGCVAGLVLAGASYGQWEISIIWGMAVALGVYLSAGVSGAHLSPAVTVALWRFAAFDGRKVLPFIVAQTLGAFCAAILVYLLYYNLFALVDGEKTLKTAGIFCTFPNPHINIIQAFATELLITAMLMLLIMALTDDGNGLPRGPLAPLLIGILVAVIGGAFGPLTGFAMNPARDFGPRLFAFLAGWGFPVMTGGRALPYFLIPLTAPVVGACLGAFVYKRCIGGNLPTGKV
ncbi:MAG: aquaporin [Desulfobulbaceae bacterium]|jgi:glycerol uptake facilitator protein|nr:aquaporin [Desulfobulbaceae bacterium]